MTAILLFGVMGIGCGCNMKNYLCYNSIPKRVIDIAGAISLLIVLAPVMLITAVLVKLSSRGPVLFCQKRLTQNGKIFTMLKFRTMVSDAEKGTGAVWAADGDSRVTKLGVFMRRTRLDELPQLFNVLCGDMSLIGPRPERPEFAEMLSNQLPLFEKRLKVKAGLTGLAQTRIGYSASVRHYRRKVALDSIYIDNCCLFLDLRIALKTINVLITGMGAR
jgi:lipopolysaccharide/colanic/teichoic acid biosynthesis glycosyltransferase